MKKIKNILRKRNEEDKVNKVNTATTSNASKAVNGDETGNSKPYVPPRVWKFDYDSNTALSANRPTAGPRFEQKLPRGSHPLQLYSMATPNGQKVTILLEELLAAGYQKAEYDAWQINILKGDQFGSEFVNVANPNSKIPALLDYSSNNLLEFLDWDKTHQKPTRVFESGSILLHLVEKCDQTFLPAHSRTEIISWLFFQVGSAPNVGQFGHFYSFAKEKQPYPIDRFTMEVKRELHLLERQLSTHAYMVGDEYTLADICMYPWFGELVTGALPYANAPTFLNVEQDYPHVLKWAQRIASRPAVQRGLIVNRTWGEVQLAERHCAKDIDEALRKVPQSSPP